MPPEQAAGQVRQLDARSDVFGLGAILCQILTGHAPYQACEQHDRRLQAVRGEVQEALLRLEASGAELELVALCQRCLAFRQEDRPPDGTAVAAEVSRIRQAAEERARRAELERARAEVHAAEQGKRRRVVQWAGAMVAAVLLLGIVGTTIGLVGANSAAEKEHLAKLAAQKEQRKAQQAALAEKQAREQAQRRLAQIEKGVELFAGMLRGINPRAEQGGDPLYAQLRQRAEHAADELVAESVADPVAVARLQTLLGDSLRELGSTRKAIELLELARATLERELGPHSPDTQTTLNNLAAAYLAADRTAEAIVPYEQARDAQVQKLEAHHPHSLTMLRNLARAYQVVGRLPEAIALYDQVSQAQRTKLGANHPETLITLNNLALANQAVGRLDEAMALFEQVRDAQVQNLGADHTSTLVTLNNLALAYHAAGRLSDAIALFEQVRPALLRYFGAGHPRTVTTLHNLASAYQAAGRLPEALALFEQAALAIANQQFQHEHAHVIIRNTMRAYDQAQQFERAEVWRRQWLAVLKDREGIDSPAYARELAALGLNLLLQQKWMEAELTLRECLAIRQRTQPDHWSTFNTMSMLGGALLGQASATADAGQKAKLLGDAEPLLVQGFQGMNDHQHTLQGSAERRALQQRMSEALDRLVALYTALEKPEQAATYRDLRASYPNAKDASN